MKAIGYTRALPISAPDSLVESDVPEPTIETNDLLVRMLALSVNPVDVKVRSAMPPEPGSVKILGWDACGVVEAVGTAAEGFEVGDRVWYAGQIDRQGCNAELHAVDARIASRAPLTLSAIEAAALPLTSLTAWESLFERLGYTPEPSEHNRRHRLLLINGAGGVGSVALQLCRVAGIPVTATASRDESRNWCFEKGATEVVGYRDLEGHGESAFPRILCAHDTDLYFDVMAKLVAPQGLICCLAGAKKPHDIQPLMGKSAGFVWELMFTRSQFHTPDMAEQGRILAAMAGLVDDGRIETTMTEATEGLTAANLREMHRKQEEGHLIGKQALQVADPA